MKLSKSMLVQFPNDGFPLSASPSLSLSSSFHHVLFSLPRKTTDRQSPQRATLISGVFDIMCQNRPHCLISACDIFLSLFHLLQHLFCVIPLCQIPPRMSRGSFFFHFYKWQMQTALVRWVAHLPWQASRSYPHLNLIVVCVFRSTVVFQLEITPGRQH